jgi:ubiquinone/menaquinone biosynthesis C-methylase UbiE
MGPSQLERIREQFTRQRDAYLRQPDVADDRSADALAALGGARSGIAALDVACGPGHLSRALARAGARAVGIDATPAFVAYAERAAREQGVEGVAFQLGDARALPFAEASFELVSCRAAFHHFPEPGRVLAEMARVLKPGARLLIADLLGPEDPVAAAAQHEVEVLCDPTHHRAWLASELEAFGREAGLRLTRRMLGELSHRLEEWLAHGGPPAPAAAEIRRRFESWCEADRSELRVRREGNEIHFSHRTGVFLFER